MTGPHKTKSSAGTQAFLTRPAPAIPDSIGLRALVLGLLGLAAGHSLCAQTSAPRHTNQVQVLAIEGDKEKFEISRAGSGAWDPAYINQILDPGDRGRTGPRSRATLRMSDLSILRVKERSQFDIKAPPEASQSAGLALFRGIVYLFHRDRPGTTHIQSKTALAATRGTEFLVEVDEPTDRMTLTLINGQAELSNAAGSLQLASGEQGIAEPGQPPRKTAVIYATNLLQWCLYYPGVLDSDELELTPQEQAPLGPSLTAYHEGDLARALAAYPPAPAPASSSERIYLAALLLSAGQVEEATALLEAVRSPDPNPRPEKLATALRLVIMATKLGPSRITHHASRFTLASEALAESYRAQSLPDLPAARQAARRATEISPGFGFAWARLAELEFSFGQVSAARAALERALVLSPRNAQAVAVKGFLLSADNKIPEALHVFDQAIALDGALGNAWLGRGLCRIRQGNAEEGREDLQVAAAMEPQRAVLRSYLGKAFGNTGDRKRAANELALARSLDPADPTGWLYSALLNQQDSRINEAVRELEHSEELNDNRRVYRSRLLLDQDRAVRGANLANIYRDAGLFDVSLREASRAVNADYGNYSAHLFLANSYNAERDNSLINLRYETVASSELLIAQLLAPAGAGTLSQYVTEQEYSRLLERDGLGVSSSTLYLGSGDWFQSGSQYGTFGNTSYSFDGAYRSSAGIRPNNDLAWRALAPSLKQQLSPQDSVFVQAVFFDYESGDPRQYYNQSDASRTLRIKETQEPNLFVGYHHEWSPGVHTLFLGGRLQDDFRLHDGTNEVLTVTKDHGVPISVTPPFSGFRDFDLRQRNEFTAYSAELQQFWQIPRHTIVAGARCQHGDNDTRASLAKLPFAAVQFTNTGEQATSTELARVSAYLYDNYEVFDSFWLLAGVSYDWLRFPENIDLPPVTPGQESKDQVSPKVGLIWAPAKSSTIRAAYTRSLGGLYYDNSVRLEPSQIAGFNQAFRSLIPESVGGLAAGARFETWGVECEQRFPTGTYLGARGELLESKARRVRGVFDFNLPDDPLAPQVAEFSSTPEELRFRERSLTLNLNQLVGEEWSFGVRYKLSAANFGDHLIAIPTLVYAQAATDRRAILHQLQILAIFNHPSGAFAQFLALWTGQHNSGDDAGLAGDYFWQFNALAGYRFAQRRVELTLGLLNLTGQDYHLNPVNLYAELPRKTTLLASVRFNF